MSKTPKETARLRLAELTKNPGLAPKPAPPRAPGETKARSPIRGAARSSSSLKAALQDYEQEFITCLLELLRCSDAAIRLGALKIALDRGYGRPAQVVQTPDGDAVAVIAIEHVIVSAPAPKVIEHDQRPDHWKDSPARAIDASGNGAQALDDASRGGRGKGSWRPTGRLAGLRLDGKLDDD